MSLTELPADISSTIRRALSEDIGTGDITADLLPDSLKVTAYVVGREEAIICGTAWFDEVYQQLDKQVLVTWSVGDGEQIQPDQIVCMIDGSARTILTGERTALNFLQLLSSTATITREYTAQLAGTGARLLDTRKTLPGLRTAQKYAVVCGGGESHRMGLYDAVLIKENHIHAAGSIATAIQQLKRLHRNIEVEVESLDEFQHALNEGADRILLDNFDSATLRRAVKINKGKAILEASGGINTGNIKKIAETGVDYISVGALTKNIQAIEFSLLISKSNKPGRV